MGISAWYNGIMAQYKVPQDVEADDKLIGPFSFRQFVYLLIAGGLVALAVGLFQIFPLLAIIPVPFILLLGALALPLKKDQPMETYLAALVSYFLKPRTRIWVPGQSNSVITVTAPKKIEEPRTRDITGEEATHRLSFLAGIVDTKGYAIKGFNSNALSDDLVAETHATNDMFETMHFDSLVDTISKDENERHETVMREMREAIRQAESKPVATSGTVQPREDMIEGGPREEEKAVGRQAGESSRVGDINVFGPNYDSDVVIKPIIETGEEVNKNTAANKKVETTQVKHSIIELANNADFSVATIAKEANRINERDKNEVFVSLH